MVWPSSLPKRFLRESCRTVRTETSKTFPDSFLHNAQFSQLFLGTDNMTLHRALVVFVRVWYVTARPRVAGTSRSWTLLGHNVLDMWKSRHLLRKSVLLPVCQSHKLVDLTTEVWSSSCLPLLRSSTWVTYGKLAPTLGRSGLVKAIVQSQAARKGKDAPFQELTHFMSP